MPIDYHNLLETILDRSATAALGHASDLKTYIAARAKLIAESVILIERDRLNGDISEDDARFAYEQIKKSEKSALLALQATRQAAAQDAINAALNVAATVLGKAIGIAL